MGEALAWSMLNIVLVPSSIFFNVTLPPTLMIFMTPDIVIITFLVDLVCECLDILILRI